MRKSIKRFAEGRVEVLFAPVEEHFAEKKDRNNAPSIKDCGRREERVPHKFFKCEKQGESAKFFF